MLRLSGIGAPAADDAALDYLLAGLRAHRDTKGAWRRFPLYYTTLALTDLTRPAAVEELRYVAPLLEARRKRLKSDNPAGKARIATIDAALAIAGCTRGSCGQLVTGRPRYPALDPDDRGSIPDKIDDVSPVSARPLSCSALQSPRQQ